MADLSTSKLPLPIGQPPGSGAHGDRASRPRRARLLERLSRHPLTWGALLVGLLGACNFPGPPDVLNQNVSIGGTVHGMWNGTEGVELRLIADGVDTTYTVTADGPFEFPTHLDEGVSYTTSIVSQPRRHTCTIVGDVSGIVGATGVSSIDVACTGPAVSMQLSAPAPWAFDPTQTTQTSLEASLLLQDVRVIVRSPDAQLTSVVVDGTPESLDIPSRPRELSLGSNTVTVELGAQAGLSKTYQVVIHRGAADVAQAVYGKSSNAGTRDFLGISLAVSGDTLVIGASGEASAGNGSQIDNSAESAGAAYVFRRINARWVQEAYLKAGISEPFDKFGTAVAISGDTIAVGAPGEDSSAIGINGSQLDNSAPHSGAVYVFQRTGTTWREQAYLKASNTGSQDSFGYSVALSGNTLAAGAYAEASPATGIDGDQGNGAQGAGAVYVFQRDGATWAQQAYIKASNTESSDTFGLSLALSGDTLAVGASGEDSSARGVNGNQGDNSASNSGAVYIFQRSGPRWAQQAYLKASNTDAGDIFSASLALSGDTLAVGAINEASRATGVNGNQADNGASNSGAVYIFQRVGDVWAQQAYLKASNTNAADEFGFSTALHNDLLSVGAHFESNGATGVNQGESSISARASGAAYLFRRDGTAWTQQAYVKASNTGVADEFGASVGLSSDSLIVGAMRESSNATGPYSEQTNDAAPNAGAFYIFR